MWYINIIFSIQKTDGWDYASWKNEDVGRPGPNKVQKSKRIVMGGFEYF